MEAVVSEFYSFIIVIISRLFQSKEEEQESGLFLEKMWKITFPVCPAVVEVISFVVEMQRYVEVFLRFSSLSFIWWNSVATLVVIWLRSVYSFNKFSL